MLFESFFFVYILDTQIYVVNICGKYFYLEYNNFNY